jgi:hypothetical protein
MAKRRQAKKEITQIGLPAEQSSYRENKKNGEARKYKASKKKYIAKKRRCRKASASADKKLRSKQKRNQGENNQEQYYQYQIAAEFRRPKFPSLVKHKN